jgi:hypothetical protein
VAVGYTEAELGAAHYPIDPQNDIVVHPAYNPNTFERDIAIMRVNLTDFIGTPQVQPAPIGNYTTGVPISPFCSSLRNSFYSGFQSCELDVVHNLQAVH